jgi:hypothetical protein
MSSFYCANPTQEPGRHVRHMLDMPMRHMPHMQPV